jgi:branched-chain amino acid transport system substrate-binding protein
LAKDGDETMLLPVTHPGVEQKATWLQIRQKRPDYVLLWG